MCFPISKFKELVNSPVDPNNSVFAVENGTLSLQKPLEKAGRFCGQSCKQLATGKMQVAKGYYQQNLDEKVTDNKKFKKIREWVAKAPYLTKGMVLKIDKYFPSIEDFLKATDDSQDIINSNHSRNNSIKQTDPVKVETDPKIDDHKSLDVENQKEVENDIDDSNTKANDPPVVEIPLEDK